MNQKVGLLAAGAVLVAVVAFLATQVRSADDNKTAGPGEQVKAAQTKPAADPKDSKRPEDEAAIRKAAADFIKLVEKGDAKGVAAAWTEDGEYIDDDGTTIRGRAAIEAAYAKAFAKKKKTNVEINIESIRFPSKDTAIEEGYAKMYRDGSDQPTCSRYSVLHVREGGKWLMAVLREWPDEGVSLHDLDWLIGTWQSKNDDTEVRSKYEWDANKNSIRCTFTIKGPGRNVTATQIIMKDPRGGDLRSWIFEDNGGFGEGEWTRDGKKWVIEASGVEADGGELTAKNILTPVDKDTFVWQSTERTLDGEDLPDILPVKVTRVK
jgi:uncharacterized protein (TIGR02246 family)